MYSLLVMGIFHCYVRLPECNPQTFKPVRRLAESENGYPAFKFSPLPQFPGSNLESPIKARPTFLRSTFNRCSTSRIPSPYESLYWFLGHLFPVGSFMTPICFLLRRFLDDSSKGTKKDLQPVKLSNVALCVDNLELLPLETESKQLESSSQEQGM